MTEKNIQYAYVGVGSAVSVLIVSFVQQVCSPTPDLSLPL